MRQKCSFQIFQVFISGQVSENLDNGLTVMFLNSTYFENFGIVLFCHFSTLSWRDLKIHIFPDKNLKFAALL